MTVLYIAEGGPTDLSPADRVAGLSFAERVFRSARRAGCDRIIVWTPSHGEAVRAEATRVPGARVDVVATAADWRALVGNIKRDGECARASTTHGAADAERRRGDVAVTVIPPGVVVSPKLITAAAAMGCDVTGLAATPVRAGIEWPASGIYRVPVHLAVEIANLLPVAHSALTSKAPLPSGPDIALKRAPLVARAATRADLPIAEQTVRRAMFKPNDTYLARFNRRMSLPVSVWLIEHTPVSANALSLMLVGLGFFAAWLFSFGTYAAGVAGALLSLAASILDGSDGEVARLKYEESAFGCWVETIGDYSYYLALFAGMTVGAVRSTGSTLLGWTGAGALAGSVVTLALLIVLRRHATGGKPEALQERTVRRFYAEGSLWTWLVARISFVATRAAMPYGIAVLAIFNEVPLIVLLACIGANVYWISLALMWPTLMPGGGAVSANPPLEAGIQPPG